MIVKDVPAVLLLDRLHITTSHIISYLDSVNTSNEQILKVLQKKPSLPEYDKLPWVVKTLKEKRVVNKLKKHLNLNQEEKGMLLECLIHARDALKKSYGPHANKAKLQGLDNYISKIS